VKIVSVIGAKLEMEVDKVIDATGKLVIPGASIRIRHMELPFGGRILRRLSHRHARRGACGTTTLLIRRAV